MRTKNDVNKILTVLDREFPESHTSLRHVDPVQLLVATVLSAQCTDERVNQVTKSLFRKYKTAEDYAQVRLEELEDDIRPTGFYRNKAKSIKKLAQVLLEKHHGRVPESLDELVKLPGVGRKTANVVLGSAFGIPGIVVDTHVNRVSQRLGLTGKKDAVKIEFDLMEQIPKQKWTIFSLQLIDHGRKTCTARKPKCGTCPLNDLCPWEGKLM